MGIEHKLHVRGGRIIDPANSLDQVDDLYIADGKIAGIGSAPEGFQADRVIDAVGYIVCPGFVDLCARFREPGAEHKATIASESRAAACGGITTVCCPPDTDPVIDTPAVAALIHKRAAQTGIVNIVTLGALTRNLEGKQLSEMGALKAAGCVGVSNAYQPVANLLILRRAMEYAATFDLTVFLHPEDPWLTDDGCVHEGSVSTRLGLPGVCAAAETVGVAQGLALIEEIGVRAHFCRLSTARATQMIARAQYDGLPITADVSAHQLHLTDMDVGLFDSQCHVRPPLRTQRDQDALRKAVAKQTVAAICSNHEPHETDAKKKPFSQTATGISAVETFLPLNLRLVFENLISLPDLIARITCLPARILGIDAGTLAPGSCADVCIFDAERHWQPTPENMISRGHNTPFMGWDMRGRTMYTIHRGCLVYSDPGAANP